MRFFCNAGSSKVSTTTATATNLSDKGPVVKMEGSLYTLSNVENTFFDTPESQAKALDQLKAILKESTNNGKFDEFDEMTMKRALWAKRNNVKSALKVMQGFQTLQEKYGKEIKLDEIKNFENRKIMIFDQNITDSDGFPIIYGGFLEQLQTMPDTDTMLKPYQMSNLLLDDILRFIIYYVQHVTQDPAIARYGITLVADLGGLSKYNQVNFSMVKQILGLLQSSLPVRLHKIIIVDAPAFFGMVWAIVKHFVSSEIHSKICLIRSNDTNTLAVHLKIELLPERLEMQCLCSAGSRSKSVIGNGGTGTMGGYLPYQQVNNSTIVSIRLWNGVSYARCIDHETRVSGVISQVVEKLCLAYPNSFAPPKSDDFVATVVEKDIIPEPNDTFRVDLSDINRWHLVVVQKRWIHSMKSCKPIGTWKEVVLKRETPLLSQLMDLCSTALDDLTLEQHKKKIFEAASGSTTTTMTSSFQIYLSHPDLMVSVLAHPSLPVPDGMRGHSAGPQGFHIIRTGFMVDMRVADLFSMLCRDYLWISNNGETFFTGSESSTAATGTATATTTLSSLFDTVKDENLKAYLMEGEGQVWELSDDTTMTVGNSQDKSEIIVEKRISVVDISSSRNIFIIVEPLKIHKKNHSRMFQLFRSAKDSFTASFQPKDSISSRHNKLVSPFHRKVSISSLHSPRPDSSTLSPSSSSSLTQLNLATDWEIDVRFNQLLCDLKITSDDQQQSYLSWNRTRKWKAISTGNLLDEPHPNPKESIDLLNARASFLTTCSSSINTTPPCSPLKPSSSRAINTSLVSPRRVVSPNPLLSQDEDLTTTSLNASQEIIQETISKLSTRPNLPNRKIIKYLRRIHESLVYHFYYQHYNDDDDDDEDDDDELENDDQDDCCYNVNSLKPDGKLDETDRLETQVVEVISGTIGTAAATRSIEVLLEAFEVLQCIVSSDRDLSNHKGLFDKIFDLCVQGLMLRDSMLGNKVLSVLINMIGPSSPFLPPEKEKDPRHKLHELDLAKWVFCQRSRLALILQCVCSQFSSLGREAPQFLVLVLGLLEEGLKNTELQQVARSDHKIVLDRLAEEVLAVLESSRDLIYLYRLLHGRDWEPLVSVSTNPTTDSCTQTDEKPEEERPGLYMQSESLCESGISLSICDSIDCAQQSSTREVTFTVDTVDTSPLPDSNFTVPVAPPLPPPPPITHAGAPPPPPPPPPPPLPAKFNSKCIETKTIEDQVIPSIPLKPLFWSKVNNLHSTTDSDVCPTIWSKILKDEIFSPKKLNISEIEDILAKDKSTTAALKCATNNGNNVVNMNSSPSALNILDINRANNIAILLSRLRIPANDIALCIKSCRPLDTLTRKSVISGRRPLTLDNLKALCKCIPTPDELKLFKAISQTEAEALKGPELYVYQLSRIYRLAPRLTILTFMMRFEEEDAIPSLCSRFLAWQKGLKQLQSSRLLERFIAIVLGLGNVMNFGSVRGKATAFSLDILFKLRDFRVSTTSTTKTSAVSVKNLFDYIGGKVMVEEQQGSHDAFNLCLRKELDQIPKLISLGLEDDIMAVRDIKQNMDRISREIEEHSGSYPKDDIIFIQVLSEFRRTHGKSVTDLCDLMEKSLLLVEETARYFTLVSVDASREVSVKAIVTFSVQMAQLLQQDSTK